MDETPRPRQRTTRHVPHRAAANLSRAVTFASELGRPLNQFVSINYGMTYCDEGHMTEAFRRLLKSFFVKWFTRHPVVSAMSDKRAAYAWVAEGRPGHHGVHWLVHLPPEMVAEFRKRLPGWLEKTAGPRTDDAAIHVQPAHNPRGAADYILKGLAPVHARRFRVRPTFQGTVVGKRCGVSECLGPTAIKRFRERVPLDAAGAVG